MAGPRRGLALARGVTPLIPRGGHVKSSGEGANLLKFAHFLRLGRVRTPPDLDPNNI